MRGGRLYGDIHGIGDSDVLLAAVPLAHSFGLVGAVMAAVVSGAALWTVMRFRPSVVLAGLVGGATVMLGTPLVYDLITAAIPRNRTYPALRVALSSGGPLTDRVATLARDRLGRPIHQVYGSTETGLIASQYERDDPWPDGCVGTMVAGVTWRLREEPSEPSGHAGGTLLVHTSTMFRGYADADADAAPSAAPNDGLYDSGDVVHVDDQRQVFVLGRKDTFVNVGGRKVNPRRIERIITENPDVREVAVYGVVDDAGEERLHAALVLRPTASVEAVVATCRGRLVAHEVPHRLHVLSALPRSGMGKVDRSGLIKRVHAEDDHRQPHAALDPSCMNTQL
jgi:acyl-coenzyme A synthetase/AMP-(fatty) acid ligase